MLASMIRGAIWSLLLVFPLAALVALCFRFPIPFSDYESGPEAALRALFAVVFYGLFGGFVVLAAIGTASGAIAHRTAGPDEKKKRRLTIGLALAGDFLAVMILATLDLIIGPW